MTSNLQTDWHQVAELDDDSRARWITEHGRNHENEEARRAWMQDFLNGTLEQEEDGRSGMMRGLLTSMLQMDDAEAKAYAVDFQYVLDHGKGETAFAAIQSLHTGARDLPVEDTLRLGHVWPRVFGKDIAATV